MSTDGTGRYKAMAANTALRGRGLTVRNQTARTAPTTSALLPPLVHNAPALGAGPGQDRTGQDKNA